MNIKNKYRYKFQTFKLIGGFPAVDYQIYAQPLGEKNLNLSYDSDNNYKNDYTLKLSGEITCMNEVYFQLLNKEITGASCDEIKITIERECNGVWGDFIVGRVSLIDIKWDLDSCTAKFPLRVISSWDCLTDKATLQTNLFEAQSTFLGGSGAHTLTFTHLAETFTIDNGIALKDIFRFWNGGFLFNCVPFVRSNFFQINPDVPSTDNYVTGLPSTTNDILVFQKSDVKRWDAVNNATICTYSYDDLMKTLNTMFNVKAAIIGNVFRIEHVSYFENMIAGFDLTTPRWAKYIAGTRKFSANKAKIPQREKFKFQEALGLDFIGTDIVYNQYCANDDVYSKEVSSSVKDCTTDIMYCISNPESDSNKVDDKGICIVSCTDLGGNMHDVQSQTAILGTIPVPNNVFGWAFLHRDFYQHDRPQLFGNMNNTDTTFASKRPIRKGEKIEVPICCTDTFDPLKSVKTNLGVGIIDKAKIDLMNDTIELELFYRDIEVGDFPVQAVNDEYQTAKDTTLIVSSVNGLLRNEINPDLDALTVVSNTVPDFGSVTVNPDGSFTYIPIAAWLGYAHFDYVVQDAAGFQSTGSVTIHVIDIGGIVVANDDTFYTRKDIGWGLFFGTHTPSHNPIANDIGLYPPFIGTTPFVTPAGGYLLLNFLPSYTPPTGFIGTDSPVVTVSDSQTPTPATDTSIMNIIVLDKIFVKLVESNVVTETITQDCSYMGGGTTQPYLTRTTKDFTLEMYADAAGTIPYTEYEGNLINGINFDIDMVKIDTVHGNSTTSLNFTPSWTLFNPLPTWFLGNIETARNEVDCAYTQIEDFTITPTLIANSIYTVI